MTRKHFTAIAEVIRELRENLLAENEYGPHAGVQSTAIALCDVFKADNPRFDRRRFLDACGIEQ